MCPRIYQIYGPLWVNGYGLMIALGFLVFTFFTYWHPWRRDLLSGEKYLNTLFVGFLSAIFGGRLLFIAFNGSSFESIAEIFYPWVGGFSLFGSIMFVLIAVSIYMKKIGVAILPFFDLIALYVPLLQAIARLGCFFAGCCYGVPTQSWFGVMFTDPYALAPLHVYLHPTQLYASIASLLIFITLYFVEKKVYRSPGVLIFLYLTLESFSRFTVDFWRGDRDFVSIGGKVLPLSSMQLIVGALFLTSLCLLLVFVVCGALSREKR